MIKLRRLNIAGFRGARFSLSLDFTPQHRSLSVFGENASGKSTITDALEWFIAGRVGHLWREDCKEISLRNVLLEPTDCSEVTVEFSNLAMNTKTLNPDLSVVDNNSAGPYHEFISTLRKENIFLRHAQITQFIQQSKSEKRKAVASIIGYDTITEFRNVLQSTQNALQKERQYTSAKQRVEDEKKTLLQLMGKIPTSPKMLYEQMNDDLKKNGFEPTVADRASYQSTVTEISRKAKSTRSCRSKASVR